MIDKKELEKQLQSHYEWHGFNAVTWADWITTWFAGQEEPATTVPGESGISTTPVVIPEGFRKAEPEDLNYAKAK